MKPEEVIRHYNALKEDYLSRRSFMVREKIDEISKEVISILKKQIGKKPILKGTSHYMISIYECGECGERADTRWNGCPYCLTKIDWSEEE